VWGELGPAFLPATPFPPVEIGCQVFKVSMPSGAVFCHLFQGKSTLLDLGLVVTSDAQGGQDATMRFAYISTPRAGLAALEMGMKLSSPRQSFVSI
jgi:hypothetical protein